MVAPLVLPLMAPPVEPLLFIESIAPLAGALMVLAESVLMLEPTAPELLASPVAAPFLLSQAPSKKAFNTNATKYRGIFLVNIIGKGVKYARN